MLAATRSSLRPTCNGRRRLRHGVLADAHVEALTLVHLPVPFWPAASSTLSTKNFFYARVGLLQDVGGDLDDVGVVAGVPVGEDFCRVGRCGGLGGLEEPGQGRHDELHVDVFDGVVDHRHILARVVGG